MKTFIFSNSSFLTDTTIEAEKSSQKLVSKYYYLDDQENSEHCE